MQAGTSFNIIANESKENCNPHSKLAQSGSMLIETNAYVAPLYKMHRQKFFFFRNCGLYFGRCGNCIVCLDSRRQVGPIGNPVPLLQTRTLANAVLLLARGLLTRVLQRRHTTIRRYNAHSDRNGQGWGSSPGPSGSAARVLAPHAPSFGASKRPAANSPSRREPFELGARHFRGQQDQNGRDVFSDVLPPTRASRFG